ncbi:MAG: magnesium transporter CorA family protein [Eubacterium sp.]|nr:magnesium transporter CorA family protein [Eubacterium sp.]
MIRVFRTAGRRLQECDTIESGSWIAMTNPTPAELDEISGRFDIDPVDLKGALDEEERSRIESEDHYTLIIMDLPDTEVRNGRETFCTIPIGFIYMKEYLITVCLTDNPVLTVFMDGRVRNASTDNLTNLFHKMLYRIASMYLRYLKIINKTSEAVEEKLQKYQRNEELLEMLELEKSLVYISTSLRGNEVVLDRLKRIQAIPRTEEDMDDLEDIIIENRQGIEMSKIYTDILDGTMDAYANIINNNMNNVMKLLAVITVVLTIPTIISSALGMNVPGIPFAGDPMGFWIMTIISIILTVVAWIFVIFSKKL